MDRRKFFRSGLKEITDALIQKTPEPIRPKIEDPAYDLSILTARPEDAEQLAQELLRDYFGATMLRLKQSELQGVFPGYVIVLEDNEWLDTVTGISMFSVNARELARALAISEPQENPTLVRFVNKTPPFSRNISVYRNSERVRTLPLGEPATFELALPQGTVAVRIADGRCSVTAAPEEDASALAHPPILTPGQRILCPHSKVTVVVG